jgi:hypothetical protein
MAVARHHVHAHMEFTDKASDGSEDLPNNRPDAPNARTGHVQRSTVRWLEHDV